MGLGGPSKINMHWDWVGLPVLLVAFGLVGPLLVLIPMGLGRPARTQIQLEWD
jgi:hypothetical protein